jgi:hypothetical protein
MPEGIFELENSDNTVSSYYQVSDVVTMINSRLEYNRTIDEEFLRNNFNNLIKEVNSVSVIEEVNAFKDLWKNQLIRERKIAPRRINHYELILFNVFSRVVDRENIEMEYRINNAGHRYDFKIEYGGNKYLIEFDGIGHFQRNRFRETVHPLDQINSFNNPDYKLIIWPYWIQRCERNLKVILGIEEQGFGAIWSSTFHFGEFLWNDSYDIIRTLNSQFNIEQEGNIGYIYGARLNYPEHPYIENKILNNRATSWTIEKLIPQGTPNNTEERNYWLPEKLKE